MKGMCHQCYSSNVQLEMVEMKNTIQDPMGSVIIPLCAECKEIS